MTDARELLESLKGKSLKAPAGGTFKVLGFEDDNFVRVKTKLYPAVPVLIRDVQRSIDQFEQHGLPVIDLDRAYDVRFRAAVLAQIGGPTRAKRPAPRPKPTKAELNGRRELKRAKLALARIGALPEVPFGTVFHSSIDLSKAHVHRLNRSRICGSQTHGAESIQVSGTFEEDLDLGDTIYFTGTGGREPDTGRQVSDQEFNQQNRSLAISCDRGLPVRVVRCADAGGEFSPEVGYRYDGLFSVESYERLKTTNGFFVWQFRLVRNEDHPIEETTDPEETPTAARPKQRDIKFSIVQRRVRNTAVTQWIKDLYDYTCQICGLRLVTASGPYAEGAHIIPVGHPHNGPDHEGNVLCLCPNDHVRFDRGSIAIRDNLDVLDQSRGTSLGILYIHPQHTIDLGVFERHRLIHVPDSRRTGESTSESISTGSDP